MIDICITVCSTGGSLLFSLVNSLVHFYLVNVCGESFVLHSAINSHSFLYILFSTIRLNLFLFHLFSMEPYNPLKFICFTAHHRWLFFTNFQRRGSQIRIDGVTPTLTVINLSIDQCHQFLRVLINDAPIKTR